MFACASDPADVDLENMLVPSLPDRRFKTQTEVALIASYSVRQSEQDNKWLSFYAMAGGSHFDAAVNEVGGQALAGDGGLLRPSLRSSPCQARMQQGQKQAQRSTT